MRTDIRRVVDSERGFSRNPLELVGLFIVLIYALTILVAGFSGHLSSGQRWAVISLVVTFPPVVLGTFYVLVTRHHTKLYAPAGWSDERLVYAPQTIAQTVAREREQLRELEASETKALLPASTAEGDESDSDTHAASATQHDLISFLREAETLALRQIQHEMGGEIVKDVHISRSGFDVTLDGILQNENGQAIAGIEVLVVGSGRSTNALPQRVVNKFRRLALQLHEVGAKPIPLIVVLVGRHSSRDEAEDVRRDLLERIGQMPVPVDIRVYEYGELQASWAA